MLHYLSLLPFFPRWSMTLCLLLLPVKLPTDAFFTTKKVKSICDYIDNYKNGVHRISPVLGKQGINRRKARELFAVLKRVMIVTVHVFIVVSHVSISRYLGTRLSGLDCRIHSSWPGWITFIKESLKLQYHVSGPWVQYFTDMLV